MTDITPAPQASIGDTPHSYGLISRLNHWITAAVFLGALGIGLWLGYAEPSRDVAGPMMQWHKVLGLQVLVWGGWRILWRVAQGFPHPASLSSSAQKRAARFVHIGLLAATLAMPVSGVLMSVAGGHDLSVFGLTLLPAWGEIEWIKELAEGVHETAPILILLMLTLHVGGALKHQLVDRDGTLGRMIRP